MEDIVARLRSLVGDYIGDADIDDYLNDAADEIERLRADVEEQARLNGAGAERELALRAEVERLRAENAWLSQDVDQKEADAIVYNLRIERLNAKNARLREALNKIAALDVPRPVATRFRADGKPTKYDLCPHEINMWDDCEHCIADYARVTFAEQEKTK